MTSNPKKTITIVKPDATRAPGLQGPRVFVGDVEIPVESLYVDWEEGTVDVTLGPAEVRIVRDVPTPAEPENMPNPERAEPEKDVYIFKADPRTVVIDIAFPGRIRDWDVPLPMAKHTLAFEEPHPGVEAATITVSMPAPKPGTSPTGCKCSACDPRGAR